MTYGLQTQVIRRSITKSCICITNTVKYEQYGWRCSIKKRRL